jgi:hypothetical protein
MRILVSFVAIIGLTSPLASLCFVIPPPSARTTSSSSLSKKAVILQRLQVVSDLNVPQITKPEKEEVPFTIPLEEICLADIPKVGGYVKRSVIIDSSQSDLDILLVLTVHSSQQNGFLG